MSLPITDPTWIFLLVLLVILFAPLLLNKLHIPHLIGMILAGVLIGEHGLNVLTRDSSFELFGRVGLYYIMFLAGLEMDMVDFRKNVGRSLLLGLLSFAVPMAMGLAAGVGILGYGRATALLLAAMLASHTLVTYPIVTRLGVSRQRSVGIAVGGTAFTDTLTLMVLAVVASMYRGEADRPFVALLLVKVLLVGAFIVYCFPRIGRWFFRRYDDGVMQFIFVLSMVFLSAGLMEIVGMEGILGAFLAGLVLNRLIPHVSPLMNHLEFVGNALFIPYFLIGVGMLVDLGVIFGQVNVLGVAAVMLVVAMGGKWIACWLTQRLLKMNRVERRMMFGLSTARAAATLAAVTVGYRIILPSGDRLLGDDVLNATVLLILLTCIASSFITQHAARRMAMDTGRTDNDAASAPERILIALSNPDTVDALVNLSLLMRDPRQRAGMVAVHVVSDDDETGRQVEQGRRQLRRAGMLAAAADVALEQISRYGLHTAGGIIHTAKEHDATDVVIGLHRRTSLTDGFFGPVTAALLRGLPRQVVIAKMLIPAGTLRRIVVAVPPKAEYEPGFAKWVAQLCRISAQIGCRMDFFSNEDTGTRLRAVVRSQPGGGALCSFSLLDDWGDLLLLTGRVDDDHLLVVITARPGSMSYDSSFEQLPTQLTRYFAACSLLIVYPDQLCEPQQEILTFYNPRAEGEPNPYERAFRWFYRWFKGKPK